MYTIVKKSFKGNMIQLLQEGEEKPKWYFLNPAVEAFVKSAGIDTGATVTSIETEMQGKDIFITKLKSDRTGAPSSAGQQKSYVKPQYKSSGGSGSYSGISASESEKISRLSVMRSVSTIVAGLINNLDIKSPQEVIDVSDIIFDHLLSRVKETPVQPSVNSDSPQEETAF